MSRRTLAGTLVVCACMAGAEPAHSQAAAGRAMAGAAAAFLQSLSADERSRASFAFDDDTRFEFRFTPRARTGVPLKDLTEPQRTLAHALLRTGLSVRGYTSATDIIALELVLKSLEPPRTGPGAIVRDPELYFVSIYGEPGGPAPWGWKFEGHHLSVNFTLIEGEPVVFAPSFFGASPATVREGPRAGARALREEEESARALMAAFTDAQRRQALFDVEAPREMITAESRGAKVLAPVGVTYGEMTPAQRRLFERVLDAYLGRMTAEVSAARLAAIRQAGMDQLRFGWAGALEPGGPHYYRVQGPTFLVEYDNVQNNANHIHSVWRDFDGDFGRDLLREHYQAHVH